MSRGREPRIVDPHTHPRRYVSLRVAAIYLELDEKTLRGCIARGELPAFRFGARWKLLVSDLVAFEARCSTRNGKAGNGGESGAHAAA